ncbi:MAG: AI-2E family transporter [Polyangiaceae bacterium]|nr:AI-2E family transporter [Polyangiaceae bacterium]
MTPDDPSQTAVARRRHAIFLGASAAIAVLVLALSHAVLLPFVLALVIAYVLTPAVAWVEKRRVSRAGAVILVYVVVLGSLGIGLRLLTPRVAHELTGLRRELPALGYKVRHHWVPAVQRHLRELGFGPGAPDEDAATPDKADKADKERVEQIEPQIEPWFDESIEHGESLHEGAQVPAIVGRPRSDGSFAIEFHGPIAVTPSQNGDYIIESAREGREGTFDVDRIVADAATKSLRFAQHNALEIVRIGRNIVVGVSRFFFIFGITLMLAAYLMLTREKILHFFSSLLRPGSRASFSELLVRIDQGLSGVVRGQLIICLVNGVLSAIGFAIIGLKYWPVLALIATIMSLIPIFGSIISAIPAVALGLTQSIGQAAFALVWIVGIHQLEANVLNPKIMGDSAKIHPVLVIFSLLVGEHFFQVVGALLAVPCMSITQSVFVHVRKHLQAADPEMANEPVGSSLVPPPPLSSKRLQASDSETESPDKS